ncbi:MAG: RNase adapter RapZ [Elusimicrobiota bacterium]|jgi:aminoglycoside/choline kinase family phosphotransferase
MEEALSSLFAGHFGEPAASIAPMKGDGSHRKLFRLAGAGRSVIGAINLDRLENQAFLAFSRHFRSHRLPVPEIYAENLDRGIYLEEDLGDTNLFQYLSANRTSQGFSPGVVEVYRKVVKLLPQFQITAGKTLDYQACYPRASFDKQSMMWDLNHFKYYFLQLANIPFHEQELEDDFKRFTDFLLEVDRDYFLYRDFQSRNVMVRSGSPWFIDYQGGRRGALHYDIASLLFDAKADLPFELREELLGRYLDAVAEIIPLDREDFLKHYPAFVYIRIMQAMGAYGLRGFYERKGHFLQSIPYAIRNLEYLLRTTELPIKLPALMGVFHSMVGSSYLRQFGAASLKLTVRIQSFSYRNGMPTDEKGHGGGFVFDCRALPNPGKHKQFAKLNGKDPEVVAMLAADPAVQGFLGHVYGLIDQSVDNYRSRNFSDLMVSFGCTGGQHRSVYCAELMAKRLRAQDGLSVELRHRELEKDESAVPVT